jgi:hypothetical protein
MPREHSRGATATWLSENSILVILISMLAAIMLGLAPELFVSDSWMTLVTGREIAQHGLPSHEVLTTWAAGRTWTDQQWLAQLIYYGADRVAGLRLVVLLHVALVTFAFASAVYFARRRGASVRSTVILATVSLFVAPWSWQLRAQSIAVPLFVWTLGLVAADVRFQRRRTLLVFPLLILWANIHGSVVLGAGLVALAGAIGLGETALRRNGAIGLWRSTGLLVAPFACVLASPYSYHLAGYYKLMFFDSPATKVIIEWQAPKPEGYLLVFFVVGAGAALLSIWKWRRLALYDLAVIAITLAGALKSARGIVWFSLALLVVLPVALDGVIGATPSAIPRRISLALSSISITVLLLVVAILFPRSDDWYSRLWPAEAAQAVSRQLPAGTSIYPGDTHSDWLLWLEPSLRGRVAYDVRFELLNGREINAIRHFKSMKPDWRYALRGAGVVVLDPANSKRQIAALTTVPGARVLYRDDTVIAIRRAHA